MDRKNLPHKRVLEHWQIIAGGLILWDFLFIHAAYFLGLWFRFDAVYSRIPREYFKIYLHFITPYAVGAIVIFHFLKMYRSMWRFASYVELVRVVEGSTLTSFLHLVITWLFYGRMPLSYYLFGAILQLTFLILPRFSYRLINLLRSIKPADSAERVMLIGAGSAGQMLLRDIKTSERLNEKVYCIIDTKFGIQIKVKDLFYWGIDRLCSTSHSYLRHF